MFWVRIHPPWLLMLVRKLYKNYICILNSFILGDSYVIVHRQMEEPKKSRGGRYIFEGNIINTREWWKQKYWKWKCFPFSSSNSSLFIVYYLYTSFFQLTGLNLERWCDQISLVNGKQFYINVKNFIRICINWLKI